MNFAEFRFNTAQNKQDMFEYIFSLIINHLSIGNYVKNQLYTYQLISSSLKQIFIFTPLHYIPSILALEKFGHIN